jgi:hypothetical protein
MPNEFPNSPESEKNEAPLHDAHDVRNLMRDTSISAQGEDNTSSPTLDIQAAEKPGGKSRFQNLFSKVFKKSKEPNESSPALIDTSTVATSSQKDNLAFTSTSTTNSDTFDLNDFPELLAKLGAAKPALPAPSSPYTSSEGSPSIDFSSRLQFAAGETSSSASSTFDFGAEMPAFEEDWSSLLSPDAQSGPSWKNEEPTWTTNETQNTHSSYADNPVWPMADEEEYPDWLTSSTGNPTGSYSTEEFPPELFNSGAFKLDENLEHSSYSNYDVENPDLYSGETYTTPTSGFPTPQNTSSFEEEFSSFETFSAAQNDGEPTTSPAQEDDLFANLRNQYPTEDSSESSWDSSSSSFFNSSSQDWDFSSGVSTPSTELIQEQSGDEQSPIWDFQAPLPQKEVNNEAPSTPEFQDIEWEYSSPANLETAQAPETSSPVPSQSEISTLPPAKEGEVPEWLSSILATDSVSNAQSSDSQPPQTQTYPDLTDQPSTPDTVVFNETRTFGQTNLFETGNLPVGEDETKRFEDTREFKGNTALFNQNTPQTRGVTENFEKIVRSRLNEAASPETGASESWHFSVPVEGEPAITPPEEPTSGMQDNLWPDIQETHSEDSSALSQPSSPNHETSLDSKDELADSRSPFLSGDQSSQDEEWESSGRNSGTSSYQPNAQLPEQSQTIDEPDWWRPQSSTPALPDKGSEGSWFTPGPISYELPASSNNISSSARLNPIIQDETPSTQAETDWRSYFTGGTEDHSPHSSANPTIIGETKSSTDYNQPIVSVDKSASPSPALLPAGETIPSTSKGFLDMQVKVKVILAIIIPLVLLILVLSGLLISRSFQTGPLPTPSNQVSVENQDIIPSQIEFPGGVSLSLNRGIIQNGQWQPNSAEWLTGTNVRRVVALPGVKPLEAMITSLQPGDTLNIKLTNGQAEKYQVQELKQIPRTQVDILSGNSPSLVVILMQPDVENRWVVICNAVK